MTTKKKILVICLDGFTWNLGRDFMAEGVMPNLAGLVEKGCHGVLRSVMPYETGPAWTSLQTGCNPGKTGIFTFQSYDREHKILGLNSYRDSSVPTIWELADSAEKTVVSINLPVTSPPPNIKGVIIPGVLCPNLSSSTIHPPEAYAKYIANEKKYAIAKNDATQSIADFVNQQTEIEQARCRVALRLIEDVDWEIFCFQMHGTDNIQHFLWPALDRSMPNHRPDDRVCAMRFYRCCDDIIGQLLNAVGADTLKFMVSDHGFTRLNYKLQLNVWLRQKGYLNVIGKSPWTITKNKIKKRIPPLSIAAKFYGYIKSRRKPKKRQWVDQVLFNLRNSIDMSKTSAFALGNSAGLIYLPNSDSDNTDLPTKLTAELLHDLGPESNIPVIKAVSPGSQIYGSNETGNIPDLVVHYAPRESCSFATFTQ